VNRWFEAFGLPGIFFQFKKQVPATVEELLMIRGVGHKIALLTLQYAFNKIQVRDLVGISIFIFITHQAIFQGIPVDIHVQNWVKFLGMIDYSNVKN